MKPFSYFNWVRHGDLTFDTRRSLVQRNGETIDLPELSYRLLVYLVQSAPQTADRDELAREVWGQEYVGEDVIAQRIALIRKALGDDPVHPTYIRTVRGKGYRWVASNGPRPPFPLVIPAAIIGGVLLCVVAFSVFSNTGASDPARSADEADQFSTLLVRGREQLAVQQADETDRAILIFEEALALRPESVDAMAGMSFALSTRVTKFSALENDLERAETLARSAIALRPESGRAWHALAYSLDSQGRVSEALAAYERAYTLDPAQGSVRSSAAYLNFITGRLHSGLVQEAAALIDGVSSRYAEIQIALALDLMGMAVAEEWLERAQRANPGQSVVVGARSDSALRHHDARRALRILDEIGPDDSTERLFVIRGRAHLRLGDRVRARQAFVAAGSRGEALLAAMDAQDGNDTAARAIAARIQDPTLVTDTWPEAALRAAEIFAVLGDDDEAIRQISRAIDLGWRDWSEIEGSPFLNHLEETPGFDNLRLRVHRELDAQIQLVLADRTLLPVLNPQ